MLIKQISVFLENKKGRIEKVTKCLGEKGINISALSIADTTDFGILRMIVSDPEKAKDILKENGFTVNITEVIAVAIEDNPGGLAKALAVIGEKEIGIEYIYAFISKSEGKAHVVLRTETPEKAITALEHAGFEVLNSNQAYGS